MSLFFSLSSVSLGWYCRKSLIKSEGFEKKKNKSRRWPYREGGVYRRGGVKPSAHYGQRTKKILLAFIKANKELAMRLKRLYSWPKKPYKFAVNMFFLVDIPTLGRVKYKVQKNLTHSCLLNCFTGYREIHILEVLQNLHGGTRRQDRKISLQ